MAILNFPAGPSDGQVYDAPNNVAYVYSASVGAWLLPTGSGSGGSAFPSGTLLSFPQASAPTGWTQQTNAIYNDASIRIVTTAGGGSGGSIDFSTLFSASSTYSGSINITAGTVGAASLTVNQLPAHNHSINYWSRNVGDPPNPITIGSLQGGPNTYTTADVGANETHTHSLSGASATGNFTSNFAVKYVNYIVAAKD